MNELAVPLGDWEGMNIDDASVKIWIPEVLHQCLEVLSERFEQSKSDLARNGLMIHLHGRFVFEQLVANRLWKLTRRLERELVIKYSMEGVGVRLQDDPRPAYIKAFGKNTCDLKVWMPMRLKEDLSSLGLEVGQSASEYMRRALTAYYLGRTVLDPLNT